MIITETEKELILIVGATALVVMGLLVSMKQFWVGISIAIGAIIVAIWWHFKFHQKPKY